MGDKKLGMNISRTVAGVAAVLIVAVAVMLYVRDSTRNDYLASHRPNEPDISHGYTEYIKLQNAVVYVNKEEKYQYDIRLYELFGVATILGICIIVLRYGGRRI